MKKNGMARYGYEMVSADILGNIARSEWAIGEKIPSIDKLEKMYPYSGCGAKIWPDKLN